MHYTTHMHRNSIRLGAVLVRPWAIALPTPGSMLNTESEQPKILIIDTDPGVGRSRIACTHLLHTVIQALDGDKGPLTGWLSRPHLIS